MSIIILITHLISIKLSYEISKKYNYNVSFWTRLVFGTGFLSLMILLIDIMKNKKASKGEVGLLIILVIVCISSIVYYKPSHIEKVYHGNILDNGKVIKKIDPITINGTLYKNTNGHQEINATIELFEKEYSLDYLLAKDNFYKAFPIDKEKNSEINEIYISKDFNSITIIFNNEDKEYNGYILSATSTNNLVEPQPY